MSSATPLWNFLAGCLISMPSTFYVVVSCGVLAASGIAISGPAGAAPPPPGKSKGNRPSSSNAPPQSFLSSAAGDMPAIASSKDEFVAVLKLAGLKKPKPSQVDRAWSALASGENRGSSSPGGMAGMYIRGVVLAAKVVAAGVLRNPDFGAILAFTLAAFVLLSRRRRWWGWSAIGNGGGNGAATGGGEAANGSGSTRAAGLLGGSRGSGGVGNNAGTRSGVGVGVRGSSSLSPRRRVGSWGISARK